MRFDGASGKVVQNGQTTESDHGDVTMLAGLNVATGINASSALLTGGINAGSADIANALHVNTDGLDNVEIYKEDLTFKEPGNVQRSIFFERSGADVGKIGTYGGMFTLKALNNEDFRIFDTANNIGLYLHDGGALGLGALNGLNIQSAIIADLLYVDSDGSGNVGIGTDAPGGKLDIPSGQIRLGASSDGSDGLNFYAGASDLGGIYYDASNAGGNDLRGIYYDVQSSARAHHFIVGIPEVMTIANEGVGIGTTSPTAELDVNGGVNCASAIIGTSPDFSQFEPDGTLTFNGNATVWEDLRVSLSTAKTPASNAPNWAQILNDGISSTGVYAYHFDDGEYIFITAQLPHARKEGSRIYPHIHFMTTTDVDPSDNFGIGLEYAWTNINDDMAASTNTATRDIATGVNTDTKHQLADVPDGGIDGTGKTISSIFTARLFRQAALVNNYAGQVIITDFDIHYEKDMAGSRQVAAK